MQPLSIGILAALTPAYWDRSFYDDRLEPIDYSAPTDLVAISIETFTARRGYQIAAEYRKRGIPVVIGGYHATLCPEETQQYADTVCIGEAESVWNKILEDFRGNRLQKTYSVPRSSELVHIAPDRNIFLGKNYFKIALVETSRGCPFKCNFCSITAFYDGTYRRRPIMEIVEEIKNLKEKVIFFVDDNIIGNREDAKQLFQSLKPLNIKWISQASLNVVRDESLLDLMVQSGCTGLLIGFESLSAENLEFMIKSANKQVDFGPAIETLRKHGIPLYGTFMFGLVGDSPKLFEETLAFAIQHKLYLTAFNHIVPFPGTPLYRVFEAERRLLYDRWWLNSSYRFGQVPFYPLSMSPTQLEFYCKKVRRDFYKLRSILKRSADTLANRANLQLQTYYFGLNLLMRRELNQKFKLPLGVQPSPQTQRYHVEVFNAKPTDDAALRNLLWKIPMPGPIQVKYLRDPSFFDALRVEGNESTVVTGRDTDTNQIVGVGSRSIKNGYINGKPASIGYLSSLRLVEEYRNGTLLARGYRLLKENHLTGTTKLYLTTIIEKNKKVREILLSRRAGLPSYHPFGQYKCMAISNSFKRENKRVNKLDIRNLTGADIPALLRFFEVEGAKKQFFPQYTVNNFTSNDGLLKGLSCENIIAGFSEGKLVGTAALWNQQPFRQSMVSGYSRTLVQFRQIYNVFAGFLKYPKLPSVGSILDYRFLSLVCIKDNNPEIFAELFKTLLQQNQQHFSFIMAGLHTKDPLLTVLNRYPHFSYSSELFVVSWEDGEDDFKMLDNRVPYLELGSL